MKLCVYTIVATILFLSPVFLVSAQASCGNVVVPADFYYQGEEAVVTPITDCGNPFNADQDVTFSSLFTLGGVSVTDGAVITIPADSDNIDLTIVMAPRSFASPLDIYRKEGSDYVLTYTAFSNHPNPEPLTLPVGVYVAALVYEDPPILNQSAPTLWQKIFAGIVPTAIAYYENYQQVQVIHFEIVAAPVEPTGASSVLFLPGIQASRLYAGEDGPGGNAYERVWEPGNNSDVRALAMNQAGETLKKVYTSDILTTITTDLLFGYQHESGSVYQGFSNFMDTLVIDETIREWYPFAYDWRYDVFDIVKNGTIVNQAGVRQYPVKMAKDLAKRSKSGKVTIVAHSNGGLLAKALMIELKKTGDEALVDQIIFLGTPQLGTPKALGTILHGYDQTAGGGLVVRDTSAREIMNNFPGAYALLPSSAYLAETDTPIISFDNSASTASYRSIYGSSINSSQVYQNFLNGTNAENRSLNNKIYQPGGANAGLLATAMNNHVSQLDSWVAPSSTRVVSIIGTGIPTIKALRYEDVTENICPVNTIYSTLSLCATERLPRPFAVMTYFGDKTVTGLSAKGYAGIGDRYYVDLIKINAQNTQNNIDVEINHANFTETNYVQDLIKNLISTTTIPAIPNITSQEPVVIESYTIQQIASPVYMSSADTSGRVSGYIQQNGSWVLKQDIPGSQYFEFAGVKYLLIPSNIDFKTTLAGQEFGSYTYKISELKSNDTQIVLSQLINATTTPTMLATVEKKNGQFGTIKTDYNQDGLIDIESTVNGVVIIPLPLYSYKKLFDSINALTIKKTQKDVLQFLAKEAGKLDIKSVDSPLAVKLEKITLTVLESTILLYQRTKLITVVQADELIKVIKFLSI